MGVKITNKGDFNITQKFLKNAKNINSKIRPILDAYGRKGVDILASNTPKDSGITAGSWGYNIEMSKNKFTLEWTNKSVTAYGTPIVILLQYGHATKAGGYVEGYDFINKAIKSLMDKLSNDLWEEITKL